MNSKIFATLLTVLLGTFIWGCSQDISPMASETPLHAEKPPLHFLDFAGSEEGVLAKTMTIPAFISPWWGGVLYQVYDGKYSRDVRFKNCFSRAIIKVPPHAVKKMVMISLTMDRITILGDINMEYAPHGLIFKKPALISLYAEGVDLSNVPDHRIDDLGYYYVNQETGEWERMVCTEIIINKEDGIVEIIDAELPHFSRYAMAYSD